MYGDVVWDNCTAELKNDIESFQNAAARIMSGATKLCNIHTLLADLRWDTLACRRRKHRLILLYKMKHGLTPSYLAHMIPNQSQDRYPLRNAESILILLITNTHHHFFPLQFLTGILSYQKHNKLIQCISLNQTTNTSS